MNSTLKLVRNVVAGAVLVIAFVATTGAEQVQFWTAAKLRGGVERQVDGNWVPVKRGDTITDQQFIRTASNGFVEFQRGKETISLAPLTVVQVMDKLGKQYTTVKAAVGEVTIVADVRDVKAFRSRYAISGGRRRRPPSLRSEPANAGPWVSVDRGRVAVRGRGIPGAASSIAKGQVVSTGGRGPDRERCCQQDHRR